MPPQRDEEINNRNGEKAKIETVIQVKPGGGGAGGREYGLLKYMGFLHLPK